MKCAIFIDASGDYIKVVESFDSGRWEKTLKKAISSKCNGPMHYNKHRNVGKSFEEAVAYSSHKVLFEYDDDLLSYDELAEKHPEYFL